MRANIPASPNIYLQKRASAAEPSAEARAALQKLSWKQYQKHGLSETRVLRLQGQDEIIFQFCKSKGWPHAQHVGTVTPYQAWLALKKLGREDYDVTKAKVDFVLWEEPAAPKQASSRSHTDESQSLEQNEASANGAHSQQPEDGRPSLAPYEEADVNVEDGQADDGTMWDQRVSAEEQVDDDEDVYADVSAPEQNGSRRRFWQFNDSRPEPEPLIQPSRKQKSPKRRGPSAAHQPREVNMSGNSLSSRFAEPISWPSTTSETAYATEEGTEDSYTTPDGWTVINDSLIDSASQELEEEGSLGRRSMEHASLRNGTERSLEGAQEVGSSRGAQHSKRGTSSLASNGIPSTASQRGSVGFQERLELSVKRFLGFCHDRIKGLLTGVQTALKLAAHSAKVAFWASTYLLRKAAWAVVGQPGPPLVHASPQIAQLCRCASPGKAHRLSLKLGYDETGRKANPLEDLPRWRVESLVGTFVLDMSLYRRALTAPSAVPDSITASYERLEYLGDGILEGIIRQFIYSRWPEVTEHAMCAMVTGLVSGRTLHDFARGLHLQRCLALDAAAQWEAKHLSGWADGMLADSFEALLAALFMDRGFNAAKTLVLRLIEEFVDLELLPYNRDYKGILGNILSICKVGRPKYRCRLVQMPEAEAQKFSLVPSKAALPGSEELLWEAAVQLRRGTWASPMVLGKAYDIRRMTAEQQAARAALQSLGLQINELSLVEANQMSMAQMAGNMPGLSILKDAVEESDLRTEDQPLQEEIEAAEVIPHVSDVGLSHNFNPATLDLAAGLRFKKAGKKGKSRPSIES